MVSVWQVIGLHASYLARSRNHLEWAHAPDRQPPTRPYHLEKSTHLYVLADQVHAVFSPETYKGKWPL